MRAADDVAEKVPADARRLLGLSQRPLPHLQKSPAPPVGAGVVAPLRRRRQPAPDSLVREVAAQGVDRVGQARPVQAPEVMFHSLVPAEEQVRVVRADLSSPEGEDAGQG